jgi:hypothetical protein
MYIRIEFSVWGKAIGMTEFHHNELEKDIFEIFLIPNFIQL